MSAVRFSSPACSTSVLKRRVCSDRMSEVESVVFTRLFALQKKNAINIKRNYSLPLIKQIVCSCFKITITDISSTLR